MSVGMRVGEVRRETRETLIEVRLDLDGRGTTELSTGIGFLDHMLVAMAVHGLFDITVEAGGDLYIDSHHTIEDTAIVLGRALDAALGDRTGIRRAGHATMPMDEALAFVALDLSGRPYTVFRATWHTPAIGDFPTDLVAGSGKAHQQYYILQGLFITTEANKVFFFTTDLDAASVDLEHGVSADSIELESYPDFSKLHIEPESFFRISEDDFELLAEALTEITEDEEEETEEFEEYEEDEVE